MKKIFYVALAAMTMVACNDKKSNDTDPEQPQGGVTISLNLETGSVEVGQTLQLTATVEPAGTAVTWASSKPEVAEVDENGLVTGKANGLAKITATAGDASASCLVTVTLPGEDDDNDMAKYLDGSDYYIFALDGTTFEKIADRVHENGDFRINGAYDGDVIPETVTCVLEIWGNPLTFIDGDGGGLNSFGEAEDYISLISNPNGPGWGNGCGGLRQVHRTVDLTGVTGDHTLVITYKTPANNSNTAKVKFTIYSTEPAGANVAIELPGNTAGEWVVVEKQMSELFSQNLKWENTWEEGKYQKPDEGGVMKDMAFYSLGLLIEPVDQGLDVDAAFVYLKPAEGGEEGEE